MDTIGSDQEKTSAVKQPAESAASGPAIPLGQDGDSQFSTPHAPSPEMNPAGETTASARHRHHGSGSNRRKSSFRGLS